MKKTLLARLTALAISAFFATVATVGVAVMMAETGEHGRTETLAATATPHVGKPATLTQWVAPAPAGRVL
ncbi:MAG: hypothetical protein ABI831_18580 [Betaproteobacteria bacterium]